LLAATATAGAATAVSVSGAATSNNGTSGKSKRLAPGVRLDRLAHNAQLVTINPSAPVRLGVVLAGSRLSDRATTQSLCRRTPHCLVAVNGDFFGPSDPLGPVVVDQHLLRSGNTNHNQLLVQPRIAPAGNAGRLRVTVKAPGLGRISVAVNTPPGQSLSLYTPATSAVTVARGQVALVCRLKGRAAQVSTFGSQGTVTPIRLVRKGTVKLTRDTVVILASQRQANRLVAWWKVRRHGGSLTYPTNRLQSAIGGFPQLIRGGRLTFNPNRPPDDGLHPRTAIGGDDRGHIWLLVVDQPVHITTPAQILLARGARWAMNLDGGGSSTMATGNRVINHPSHGVQRPVASAVVLVAVPEPKPAPAPPPPAPSSQAPAPAPASGLPSLPPLPPIKILAGPARPMITPAPASSRSIGAIAAVAFGFVVTAGAGVGLTWRRLRKPYRGRVRAG
jgi:hypothetical protein